MTRRGNVIRVGHVGCGLLSGDPLPVIFAAGDCFPGSICGAVGLSQIDLVVGRILCRIEFRVEAVRKVVRRTALSRSGRAVLGTRGLACRAGPVFARFAGAAAIRRRPTRLVLALTLRVGLALPAGLAILALLPVLAVSLLSLPVLLSLPLSLLSVLSLLLSLLSLTVLLTVLSLLSLSLQLSLSVLLSLTLLLTVLLRLLAACGTAALCVVLRL